MTQVFCREKPDIVLFIVEKDFVILTEENRSVLLRVQVPQFPAPSKAKDKSGIFIEIRQLFQKVFCGQSIVFITIAFKDNDTIPLFYACYIIIRAIMEWIATEQVAFRVILNYLLQILYRPANRGLDSILENVLSGRTSGLFLIVLIFFIIFLVPIIVIFVIIIIIIFFFFLLFLVIIDELILPHLGDGIS